MKLIGTWGYTGHSAEELDAYMANLPSALLIDVRYQPLSRAPQWRHWSLAKRYGERYYKAGQWFGNLNYKNGGPIELADPARGLMVLEDLLKSHDSVILLCACASPARCHRQAVLDLARDYLGLAGYQYQHFPPELELGA